MLSVIVKGQYEGLHSWRGAPSEADFLRYSHRHVFYWVVGVEVIGRNREIEFFDLKRFVANKISLKISPIAAGSCEEQAIMILACVKKRYPGKKVFVEIWEDNENGARVEE